MIIFLKKLMHRKTAVVLIGCLFTGIFPGAGFSHASSKVVDGKNANSLSDAQKAKLKNLSYQPIKTGNPRATIQTFMRLREKMEDAISVYKKNPTYVNLARVRTIGSQFLQLIDLSTVPNATKWEIGVEALTTLLDIFGRINLPKLEDIPDNPVLKNRSLLEKWKIPKTPINIIRIEDGPREGEYLFSSSVIEIVPGFYQHVKNIPLKSRLKIKSWKVTFAQFHGPFIPAELVELLPRSLKKNWFGTPIWKNILMLLLVIFFFFLIALSNRVLKTNLLKEKIPSKLRYFFIALEIILLTLLFKHINHFQIHPAGFLAKGSDLMTYFIINLSLVWIFWVVILGVFEWIILSPKIPDTSLDANLLRLLARIIGFIGGVFIIAFGANNLGLPVFGLFAGLGVGGVAVALAIRPTLENLIGGFILFLDQPVRIGDFCSFGTYKGTVENIGLRSTQIRAWDRTLITVPNATLANMEIANWAQCDQMLILTTIGLRYETEVDQLRFVLAKLREMFLSHPSIDNDTVRVRFANYGSSSLDIEIRVYALAREWNGFYAIREDVFLRVKEIVEKSGTSFAFPSQTLYMGKDSGLDETLGKDAVKQVKSWRSSGNLPFPGYSSEKIEEFKGTLDYPPKGSIYSDSPITHIEEEPLSAEHLKAELEDEEKNEEKG
jgi:MscS family membrane protein